MAKHSAVSVLLLAGAAPGIVSTVLFPWGRGGPSGLVQIRVYRNLVRFGAHAIPAGKAQMPRLACPGSHPNEGWLPAPPRA